MTERPSLSKDLDSTTFRNYYYLKEELISFCRSNKLPTSGGKIEITERIAYYLDTGKKASTKARNRKNAFGSSITENSEIESDFVCSECHRDFFEEHIGKSFSFNVTFQKWLKSNSGKTYREAIDAYYQINADNQGKHLEEAIVCWKYKKRLPGHNRYERTDLIAIEGHTPSFS